MTDDLVKRLRSIHTAADCDKAADRIEQLERELSISRMAQVVMDNSLEALTAERDKAYASGYSDAETEISKSALGQRNDLLHAQYANAADRIKDLQAERDKYEAAWMTAEGKLADAEAENDRAWAALWDILACETPNANATVTRMVAIAKAALKGESRD